MDRGLNVYFKNSDEKSISKTRRINRNEGIQTVRGIFGEN